MGYEPDGHIGDGALCGGGGEHEVKLSSAKSSTMTAVSATSLAIRLQGMKRTRCHGLVEMGRKVGR